MDSPVLRKAMDVDSQRLLEILKNNQLEEFSGFIAKNNIDGRTLMNINETALRQWKINSNADKLITFIKDFNTDPHKYTKHETIATTTIKTIENVNVIVENQYQTVNTSNKVKERNKTIDEIMKTLVPAKSFLYRYQKPIKLTTSYVPMEATPKKQRKFFRLSSYEYPFSDLKSRFSRNENFNDRGYYSVKTNKKVLIHKTHKSPETKTKYKSMSTADELKDEVSEDHFYEDLCYNDNEKDENKISNPTFRIPQVNVKPCVVKIQEMFNSFKIPFLKKTEETKDCEKTVVQEDVEITDEVKVKSPEDSSHLYENNDSSTDVMYDYPVKPIVPVNITCEEIQLPVEEYLEPIPIEKEYCDVGLQREDSLFTYIMNLFENFGLRKETNDAANTDESDSDKHDRLGEKPKRPVDRRLRGASMADRPLPVPVENEAYYMNISRVEAEGLLMGQSDGTFILRPTTQPNHAYTLTVACGHAVHNVGVRRRPDGRLALGYARKGERSFTSIASLLRHHRKRRLLLVASGGVLGATTLNESPVYYQAPKSLPVSVLAEK